MKIKGAVRAMLFGTVSILAGCGGGGSGGTPVAITPILSGVAAVGSPIIGGAISARCAAGSALAPATTGSSGDWQLDITGQTLPCAVQVSGGTINGAANATPYHSIATAAGTVNVTPLTDLMVANLAGTASPATWFAGLTSAPAPLAAVSQSQVDGALTQLRTALPELTPLATLNPITTAFTPVPGNQADDMLAALATAMSNSGSVTHASLLTSASAPTITPPAGFGTALTSAYAGTSSGGASAIPAIPTGVSATASGSTQIDLNWVSVSGATGYNIYRSTSASVQIVAGNKINAAPVQAGPFQNTGLTASTAFYYKVTAVNTAGESVGSVEVSATTTAVGGATPTITGFSPASGAVGDTITITGNNFGAGPAGGPKYDIKFNGVAASTLGVGTTSMTVTVPAGATTGAITITTTAGSVTSTTDFTVTASAPTAPAAPTGTTASAVSASQIALGWTAVTGATSYNIYRSTSANVQTVLGNKINASPVTVVQFGDNGLAASTAYYYKVTAVNAVGESVASSEVSATTAAAAATTPATPNGVTATAASSTQINLTWTAVADATSYNIYRGTAAGVVVGTASKINTTTLTTASFNDTGLTASTAYYYKVAAVNAAGESVGSAEVSATTSAVAATTLATPTGVVATAASSTQINLTWTAVTGATSYNVYRSTATGVAAIPDNKILNVAAASTSVIGLMGGTSYSFVVTAANASGESIASSEVSAITNPIPAGVTVPTTASIAPLQDKKVLFGNFGTTVLPPATDQVILRLQGYAVGDVLNIYRSTSAGVAISPTTYVGTSVLGSFTQRFDTGLTAGTKYYYKTTVTNAAGEGPVSTELIARTPLASAGPGAGLTITPALKGVGAIENLVPHESNLGGGLISSFNISPAKVFEIQYNVDAINGDLLYLYWVDTSGGVADIATLDVTGATKMCAITSNATYALCSSIGITYDQTTGSVTFLNTPMAVTTGTTLLGTKFTISGAMNFTPY